MKPPLLFLIALLILMLLPPALAQDAPELVLRNPHYFVVVGDGQAAPSFTAEARDFGYPNALAVEVTDPIGNTRLSASALSGSAITAEIPGAPADLYLVSCNMGTNGVVFSSGSPWAVYAAGRIGVGSNGPVPEMFLYVPEETEAFTFSVQAISPNEGGRVVLSDPAGAEAVVFDGDLDQLEEREVTVPEASRGAVWSITWADPQTPGPHLEDINVFVGGPITPLLWIDRDWAAEHGEPLWQRHKAALAKEEAR